MDAPLEQVQVGRATMELTRLSGAQRRAHAARNDDARQDAAESRPGRAGRSIRTFDVNAALRAEAPELMQRRMRESVRASSLYSAALETKEFMEQLPGRVNRLLDAATNNQLRVNVDLIDEGAIMGDCRRWPTGSRSGCCSRH